MPPGPNWAFALAEGWLLVASCGCGSAACRPHAARARARARGTKGRGARRSAASWCSEPGRRYFLRSGLADFGRETRVTAEQLQLGRGGWGGHQFGRSSDPTGLRGSGCFRASRLQELSLINPYVFAIHFTSMYVVRRYGRSERFRGPLPSQIWISVAIVSVRFAQPLRFLAQRALLKRHLNAGRLQCPLHLSWAP